MYRNRKKLLVLSICATLGAVPFTLQAEEAARERTLGSVERSHASNARALLDQAVLTYQAKGPEQALATFNAWIAQNKDWLKARHNYWFKTQDWSAMVPS